MNISRDMQHYDKSIMNMRDNFVKVVEENEKRRKNMEQDFKEIQSRLDRNRRSMESIKMQIDKVSGVLTKLKDFTLSRESIVIGDSIEVDEEHLKKDKEELLKQTKEEMMSINKSISDTLSSNQS